MSSAELNKIFAAILLAGLIAMLTGFLAGKLVSPSFPAQTAYQVDTGAVAAAPSEPEAPAGPEPVSALLASANVDAGRGLFRQCSSCHTIEQGGPNRVGPNLWGIVGAPHAHAEGFAYSAVIAGMADKPWTYEELNTFIANPRAYAPGTKMNYAGLRNVQDRANLIAWLRTQHSNPPPLP